MHVGRLRKGLNRGRASDPILGPCAALVMRLTIGSVKARNRPVAIIHEEGAYAAPPPQCW